MTSRRGALVGLITRYPVLKLFSLGVAVFLVWMVRQDTIREVEIRMPVVTILPKKGVILLQSPPTEIRLQIQGPLSRLAPYLQRAPEPFVVDLDADRAGSTYQFSVEVLEDHLEMQGARISAVYPPSFEIQMDSLGQVTLPVRANLQGMPSRFVYVDHEGISITPAQVTLTGPESRIRGLREVLTDPIDISGFDRSYGTRTGLVLPGEDSLAAAPDRVDVLIPFGEKRDMKPLADVVIDVVDCPAGYSCAAIPPTYSVRVAGTGRQVATIHKANIGKYIWIDGGGIRAPTSSTVSEIYGPVSPVVRNVEGLEFELDDENRYFKIRLRKQRTTVPEARPVGE
ncbi:MAG: YbbR-like domain-containing protein [Deltaproteobacteria bacterium]|nr:YbbR-like domain-containing protein [Deltaproteobacteria bacterium]